MAAVRDMISRVTSAYRPLPAPTSLKVTGVTDNSVSLSWSPSDKATGYDIKQDDFKVNPTLITSTNYTVTGLQSGSTYSFTVNSEDSQGDSSGDSDEVIAKTTGPAPPLTPPKDLSVHETYSTSVVLTWTVVKGASGYNVYRNTSRVTSSPASGATYTDTGLTAETAYSYTVTAVGDAGESAQVCHVYVTITHLCYHHLMSCVVIVCANRSSDKSSMELYHSH
jgi:chitodextrinase